jgi:hypothetical protein
MIEPVRAIDAEDAEQQLQEKHPAAEHGADDEEACHGAKMQQMGE